MCCILRILGGFFNSRASVVKMFAVTTGRLKETEGFARRRVVSWAATLFGSCVVNLINVPSPEASVPWLLGRGVSLRDL